ncbi:hypothetical protein [Aureivirga marina]|uniref:hypothetical protein n=1 Tax=Aureivirga marina TaxID=1182451 RepID=UPI0018CAC3B9|nr:hypothetical protein [Aureivirga marina]
MKTNRLHSVFSILISFSILFYSIQSAIILSSFYLNQEYIAKNLCVQKDNQQGCNGKCHLVKTLNDSFQQQDLQNPEQEKNESFSILRMQLPEEIEITFHSIVINTSKTIFSKNTSWKNCLLQIDLPPPKVSLV